MKSICRKFVILFLVLSFSSAHSTEEFFEEKELIDLELDILKNMMEEAEKNAENNREEEELKTIAINKFLEETQLTGEYLAQVHFHKAMIINNSSPAESNKIIETAISIHPNNGQFYSIRGMNKFRLRDKKGAEEDLLKALEVTKKYNPEFKEGIAAIYNNLSIVTSGSAKSKSYTEKAIEANPEDPLPYINLSDLYAVKKDYYNAKKYAQIAKNKLLQEENYEKRFLQSINHRIFQYSRALKNQSRKNK